MSEHQDNTPQQSFAQMLRSPAMVFYEYAADGGALLRAVADRIDALEAKVERLRQGLHAIVARLDEDWDAPALRGFGSRGSTIHDAKRFALDALEEA